MIVLNEAIKAILKSQQKDTFVRWFQKEYPTKNINVFIEDKIEHQVGVIRLFFNTNYNLDWWSGLNSYAIHYFNGYLNLIEYNEIIKKTNFPFIYEVDIAFTEKDKDTRNVDINAIIKIIEHLTF